MASGKLSAHDLVAAWAGRTPDAVAIREPATGRETTYRELWHTAGQLAGDLAAHGVRHGDIVGLALDRSTALIAGILAVARAGAAYLPLDAANPADRTAALIAEAGVRVVITDPGGRHADRHLPSGPHPVPAVPSGAADAPDETAGDDDALYVAYTSGSTGRPKGVVVPHRAVIGLVSDAAYCPLGPGDRVAALSNPAFDATTFEVWSTLTAGATVVVLPAVTDHTLDDWIALLRAERITTMFLTTSLFHMVARERPAAFATLRDLMVGGEQLHLAAAHGVLAAQPPHRLINVYGPTETTTFAAYHVVTAENLAGVARVPIGRALQHTTLYVLGETLDPVPGTEIGELCIGGPKVALGYLGRAGLTAERFVHLPGGDLVYRTGDLARLHADGTVELLGRRDRQVKLRGFRIELAEIEQAIMATGLAHVAIVEKAGDGPAAFLAGFVLPAAGTTPAPSALSASLADRLPAYMIPARWVVVDVLPVGPTGKADRNALLALLETGSQAAGDDEDPAVTAVRETWRDVLGIGAVGAGDAFIDLGGNSILAIQAASRLTGRLGAEVEPADVLLAASAAELGMRFAQTFEGNLA